MLKDWNGNAKVPSSAQWNLLTNRASIAYLRAHTYELEPQQSLCLYTNNIENKKCKNILSTQISFSNTSILFKVTTPKKVQSYQKQHEQQ